MRSCCALLCLCCVTGIWAADLSWGAKAGLTLSQFWGDDADQADLDEAWLPGFTGGAFFTIGITDIVGFQPALIYSMKGARNVVVVDNAFMHMETEYRYRLHYFEVPLQLVLSVPLNAPLRPYCLTGVSPAFCVGAKYRLTIDGDAESDDADDAFETFDIGIPFGCGAAIEAGPGAFLVEFRFTLGIARIGDENSNGERPEMRNRGLSFLAGYEFGM